MHHPSARSNTLALSAEQVQRPSRISVRPPLYRARGARTCKKTICVASRLQKQPLSTEQEEEEKMQASCSGSNLAGTSNEDEPDQGQTYHTGITRKPEQKLRKELSGMSFEELLQLQNKVGTKLYNKVAYGAKTEQGAMDGHKMEPRLNKNRPVEVSAKKPVPFLRQVVPVRKKVLRDPRFDSLSGEYNPDVFEKTYSFLKDIKEVEEKAVQKALKKTRDPAEKEKLQQLLQRMIQQETAGRNWQRQQEQLQIFKCQQRNFAKEGKKPFYLKKSEKRKLELAEKYEVLKKSGKLESFLSKKRKRNASKDKRKMPVRKDL
nr:ribosomal RNA processing protein 36 homolog isoform X2 [Geotrypetes seraphini]XP_033794966.1 ribosomal RNA processing protein 36 homolog isoform X2 [Geotrypetes seraphini]XP_033794967.1 ribosomal RNA processing protein 36 homolog isoform X2 [Geotrypetes seraphini]